MKYSENPTVLLDIYGALLSEGQRTALRLRYEDDLSLSEIAEELGGVTRQSVVSAIKKGEKRLRELEALLGIAAATEKTERLTQKAKQLLKELSESCGKDDTRLAELSELLDELNETT